MSESTEPVDLDELDNDAIHLDHGQLVRIVGRLSAELRQSRARVAELEVADKLWGDLLEKRGDKLESAEARVKELESRLASLACPMPGCDGDIGCVLHGAMARVKELEARVIRVEELETDNAALTDSLACPDCHDGGACLPGGCGVDGCERCGKSCPTCGGSCELEPVKLVARVKELEAAIETISSGIGYKPLRSRSMAPVERLAQQVDSLNRNLNGEIAEHERHHVVEAELQARAKELEAENVRLRESLADAWAEGCEEGIDAAQTEYAPLYGSQLAQVYGRNPYKKQEGGPDEV